MVPEQAEAALKRAIADRIRICQGHLNSSIGQRRDDFYQAWAVEHDALVFTLLQLTEQGG